MTGRIDPSFDPGRRPFRLEAVLFDFDGTLTAPGALDFVAIKRAVGCPPDRFLLEYIEGLPGEGGERENALATLARFELDGAGRSRANPGAGAIVAHLRELGLKLAIISRNGRAAVEHALEVVPELHTDDFAAIITRDDPLPPKPAPDMVLVAADRLGVSPEHTMMVGDYVLDMQAGRSAGAVTVYLTNGSAPDDPLKAGPGAVAGCPDPSACDFIVDGLDELATIVRLGLPLPAGKLPNDLLAGHLRTLAGDDPAVLVGAGVGEDVAALALSGEEVLVVHADPITLAASGLGRYALRVNANDIATSGAEPRWFVTTVLLPPGTTPSQALHLLGEIAAVAADDGIAVVGGHSEITDAVTRPTIAGTMLGTVARADLRDKRGAAAGDRVILTKALAIEGTALLAQRLGERLRALGMTADELAACRSLLERIGVLDEARIACGFPGVSALHDVTEGGLATALEELGTACDRGITVDRERIAILPETRRVCGLLGIDPLGLIASGSLLVCCAPGQSDELVHALDGAGIGGAVIGTIGEPGRGIDAREDGRAALWPRFAADEAARLL